MRSALSYCSPLTANCSLFMSTIQRDFDRIALVSPDGSLQNNQYHNLLLRQLSSDCQTALEIGCGKVNSHAGSPKRHNTSWPSIYHQR